MSQTDDLPDDVREVLTDLIALERDRELGYPSDELHAPPRRVLQRSLDVLSDYGVDPSEIVWDEDADSLGLRVEK